MSLVYLWQKKDQKNTFIAERQRIKRVSMWKIKAENRHNREKLNRRLKDRETEDWLHYLLLVPCDLGPSGFRTTGWFVQTKEKERLATFAEVGKKGWDKWRICVILLLELKWHNNDTLIAQQFLPIPLCLSALERVCVCQWIVLCANSSCWGKIQTTNRSIHLQMHNHSHNTVRILYHYSLSNSMYNWCQGHSE